MSRSSKRDIRSECKAVMLDLMRAYSIEQITVTQICQAASISRVTFYIYYDDKYMLLDDFFDDLWGSAISDYKQQVQGTSGPVASFRCFFSAIVHMYFANRDVFAHAIADADRNLNVRYYRNIREYTETLLLDQAPSLKLRFTLEETSAFLCTGMLGLFNEMMRQTLSEEKLTDRFTEFITILLDSGLFIQSA